MTPPPSRTGTIARCYDGAVRIALGLLAPLALAFVVLHILWGLLTAALLFPLLPQRARDALVQFWSRILLVALGVRLQVRVEPGMPVVPAGRGSLLLINHVSWLDVFAICAVWPVRFVAKSEVATWPLLGWLAIAVGTLFVERGRRHAVHHVNHSIAGRLQAGHVIGIFPEGTTSDGRQLLRFHANLVQPAIDAHAAIVPVGVQYLQDGRPSMAAAYVGDMNLFESIWRVLLAPRLTVALHWLPQVAVDGRSRQLIAREARSAIGAALGVPELDEESGSTPAMEPDEGDAP